MEPWVHHAKEYLFPSAYFQSLQFSLLPANLSSLSLNLCLQPFSVFLMWVNNHVNMHNFFSRFLTPSVCSSLCCLLIWVSLSRSSIACCWISSSFCWISSSFCWSWSSFCWISSFFCWTWVSLASTSTCSCQIILLMSCIYSTTLCIPHTSRHYPPPVDAFAAVVVWSLCPFPWVPSPSPYPQ